MIAIEISSLTKSFGGFVAVDNVSMTINKGEFMGLLGPNGAGKTTILKLLSGMIRPTSGNAKVNGIDCAVHHKAMKAVGCVIETPECYSNFTPVEMLRYIGNVRGISKSDVDERIRIVLDEVKMWEWRNDKIGNFSKGMKQRVALAQALLSDPEILILDEPTSGLDPRGMVEVRDILSSLKGRGLTMLISTHMLNEVSELCDSVTMIRQGKVVVSGKVRELLTSGKGEFRIEIETQNNMTKEFLSDIEIIYGKGNVDILDDFTFVVASSEKDAAYTVVDMIREHNLGLRAIKHKGSDLESLYMSLTQDGDRNDVR